MRRDDEDDAALSSAYLFSGIGSAAICIFLLTDDDPAATPWAVVFGALAAFQLFRHFRDRG